MFKPLCLVLLAGAASAAPYEPAVTGSWPVATSAGEWRDAARDREIPWRIYQPDGATGRCPLIVFSHGLGGTRDGYAYLGRAWAAHGFIALHLQHHGSDDAVWRQAKAPRQNMQQAAANGSGALDRLRDVSFALDQVVRDPAFAARVDTNRIGIAGHSYGSWTVLAAAGQKLGPLGSRLADPRIRAGLAMSSPVPRRMDAETYRAIQIPLLHMTGTEDTSPITDTTPAQRRIPYDRITAPGQFLVVFQGGDHMIFSGRPRAQADPRDARFQELITLGSLAFWDAFLRDDVAAKAWLEDGGYTRALLGEAATFEHRL
jgi:predicted dienelactone hydrolase